MLPATLYMAVNEIRASAKETGMRFWEYGIDWAFSVSVLHRCSILVGQGYKPNVNVVLLEDLAAVLGVCVAGTAMGLSLYLQSPIPDAIGSLVIGCILGGVASFIIYSNTAALVGRSVFDRSIAVPVFIDVAVFRLDRFIPIRLRRSTMI